MKKLSVLLSITAYALGVTVAASSASASTLGYGIQSEHVLDLQERLSSLGYFNAGLTGYYGSVTTESVSKFQRSHGLPVNGKADSITLDKLKQVASPKQDSLEQMARIIYSEARGESFQGQVAVGAIILNRVQSNLFPDSIPEVIFQHGQFSSIPDGQYWLQPNQSAYDAARAALNGSDPTNGALLYYNPAIATASWSLVRPQKITIGNHVFTL